ncbi:MAG: hypothetical protein JEZ09_09995 [Salinivirgaceae bacterium]|nr:hypothetical protein [Salinivirgaceae bacterium]
MSKTARQILALVIILIPFYGVSIAQKILFSQADILVEEFFGTYMLLSIGGILTILLLNKYLLKNNIQVFRANNSKLLIDISLALLLLSIFYFVQSLERYTYGIWLAKDIDRTAIISLLNKVFSNTLYSLIIIGPFNWFNEGFVSISIAFILINLWSFSNKKIHITISIVATATIIALLQINNGWPSMINSFIIISIANFIFYKYRSIIPILIASIAFQTIDLVGYWIYSL